MRKAVSIMKKYQNIVRNYDEPHGGDARKIRTQCELKWIERNAWTAVKNVGKSNGLNRSLDELTNRLSLLRYTPSLHCYTHSERQAANGRSVLQ